jgi:hypothetical protein
MAEYDEKKKWWFSGMCLPEFNPGIQFCVDDIGKDIDNNKDDGDKQHGAHDDGEVVFFEGIDDDHAQSFPVEDIFDKDGAGQ